MTDNFAQDFFPFKDNLPCAVEMIALSAQADAADMLGLAGETDEDAESRTWDEFHTDARLCRSMTVLQLPVHLVRRRSPSDRAPAAITSWIRHRL